MANFIYRPKLFRSFRQLSKRWCENHPTSIWGDEYPQCAEGFRKKEPCKDGFITEKGEK